jgi:dTDP-4-amino-4,6-dideoxygalactose transaminase
MVLGIISNWSLGYNYRMTDIQAALGLSQLKRLDEFVSKRHEVFQKYLNLLSDLKITLPYQSPESISSLHLYIIRVKANEFGVSRKEVFERLRAGGILVNLHYIPIYRQPFYKKFGYNLSDFVESENYYKEAISLPMYPDLVDDQLNYIRETIIKPIGHQTVF